MSIAWWYPTPRPGIPEGQTVVGQGLLVMVELHHLVGVGLRPDPAELIQAVASLGRPHLGSNRLPAVVKALRQRKPHRRLLLAPLAYPTLYAERASDTPEVAGLLDEARPPPWRV